VGWRRVGAAPVGHRQKSYRASGQSQLDSELRQVNSVIGVQLRAAIEAATAHVIAAAGGPEAARVFPLALRVRADLTNTVIFARNQVGQATRSKISTEDTETH
jgi:hypothetical protein